MTEKTITKEYMSGLTMSERARAILKTVYDIRVSVDDAVRDCFLACKGKGEWEYDVTIKALEWIGEDATLEDTMSFGQEMYTNNDQDILQWISEDSERMGELDSYIRRADGSGLTDILYRMQVNAAESIYVRVWKELEKFSR